MKTVIMLILVCYIALPVAYAKEESCYILKKGNKRYSSGEYNKALNIYKLVEDVDKQGKQTCTKSIYATIASIYTMLGDKHTGADAVKAADYYKRSSSYNRAFAYAVACSHGNCELGESFWVESFGK